MWTKKLAAMLLAAVMIFSAATPAFAETEYNYDEIAKKIAQSKFGVCTENDTIFVRGLGMGPKGVNVNGSFYKSFARQAARFDAFKQLAEIVQGLEVSSESTMEDMILKYEKVIVKVDSTKLKGVTQLGEAKFLEDGTCEVIMKMPNSKN